MDYLKNYREVVFNHVNLSDKPVRDVMAMVNFLISFLEILLPRNLCRPVFLCALLFVCNLLPAQPRDTISLNENWKTALIDSSFTYGNGNAFVKQKEVRIVNVPHNWDDYFGYRRLVHGNLHSNAMYSKTFFIRKQEQKRYLLFFEGVGSFATVWVNGIPAGKHAGGRTSFTLDVTDLLRDGENILDVLAEHPAYITTLPWVCGGCSDERGFSEGSQPLGIFRPVHLMVTNDMRITPFGIHAWADVEGDKGKLYITTTVKNEVGKKRTIEIKQSLVNAAGKAIASNSIKKEMNAFDSITISSTPFNLHNIRLWSVEDPYLYTIVTQIYVSGKLLDEVSTDFGFRTIQWLTASHQFLLNGKPVFINGVAEYEHLIGQSHAFTHQQIISRVKWLQAAGFNSFRDAHQPHNLFYGKLFNQRGILWWTQMSAHIWYDTPEFRSNFKQLLKDWVIERRNDPSVIMWGLQNESTLPKEFAEECTQLIRSLDPTASAQRLVTTCNGGEGTDWNVPQNWTGTYGGNPDDYAKDLKKQILVGEYGAWRTLDMHTEGGYVQDGPASENRFALLMEKKVRLAESVKDSVAGHYFWLLTSHDNPRRVQSGEGFRELDRVGPVNYKGMLTPWEEPTDVFYMYRSNYVPASKEPMVYIASHTWPNRWLSPGIKDSIKVYSNCDEVELFNDVDNISLGKRRRNGTGTHFLWNRVNIRYNVLYAVGFVDGRPVAKDTIVLFHLPKSPDFNKLFAGALNVTRASKTFKYLYRVNCGGPDYKDINGNLWRADCSLSLSKKNGFGSESWTDRFPGMAPYFASQRRTFAPVKGSEDWPLFQTFRYGRRELNFEFTVDRDEWCRIELYFSEPWVGNGNVNAEGMRLFDVAVNDSVVLKDFDIWKEAGLNHAVKKVFYATAKNGKIIVSFPGSDAGQAIISAIAVAKKISLKNNTPDTLQEILKKTDRNGPARFLPAKYEWISPEKGNKTNLKSWLDIGDRMYHSGDAEFHQLPPVLFGAYWLQWITNNVDTISYAVRTGIDFFVGVDTVQDKLPQQLKDYELTGDAVITSEHGGKSYQIFRKRLKADDRILFTKEDGELNHYLFLLQPSSSMQPAFDLKPVTSYKSDVAIINSNVVKKMVSGNERTVIISNKEAEIVWPVTTGVADIYAVTLKYYSSSEREIHGVVQLLDAEHNKMMDEPVTFKFTRPGKWNTLTLHTGSMINAGHYKVKLSMKDAEGLVVSNIEIQ